MTDRMSKPIGSEQHSSETNGHHNIEDAETQGPSKHQKKIPRKQIILNPFDMSGTIRHLSPG